MANLPFVSRVASVFSSTARIGLSGAGLFFAKIILVNQAIDEGR